MDYSHCVYFGIVIAICCTTSFCVVVRPRQRRFVPGSATNTSISAFIANAQSVYCSDSFGLDSGLNGKAASTAPVPQAAWQAMTGGANQSRVGGSAATTPAYFAGFIPTAANVARITPLNDSQMQEVFQHKGGTYLPEYMATTQKEAVQHFPDLLLMTAPVKAAGGSNSNLTVYDNYIAQQTIVDDLRKLLQYASSTKQHTPLPTNHPSLNHLPTVLKAVLKTSFPSTTSRTSETLPNSGVPATTEAPDVTTRPANTSNTGDNLVVPMVNSPYDSLILGTSKPHINMTKDSQTDKEIQERRTYRLDSTSSKTASIKESVSTTPDKHPTSFPNEGYNFEHLIDWSSVWNEANTTVHPEALLELELANTRRKRQTGGSISTEQYCQLKGSKTQDGYLHMCSTCAVITQLPDNYFPRFINEAVCKTGDSGCFVINGLAHGECRQRTITLNIMRKKPNRCLLITHNGETTLTEDWELYPQTVRVSCECLIKKNSFLARYVKGSIPHG